MEIAMQVNDYENGVCPEWLRVERIVSHKGGDGAPDDGTKYLVKWEVLGYQECTWEAAEDLQMKQYGTSYTCASSVVL